VLCFVSNKHQTIVQLADDAIKTIQDVADMLLKVLWALEMPNGSLLKQKSVIKVVRRCDLALKGIAKTLNWHPIC